MPGATSTGPRDSRAGVVSPGRGHGSLARDSSRRTESGSGGTSGFGIAEVTQVGLLSFTTEPDGVANDLVRVAGDALRLKGGLVQPFPRLPVMDITAHNGHTTDLAAAMDGWA